MNIPYSAEQMYRLVRNVDAYSTFIPLCTLSKIVEEHENDLKVQFRIAKGNLGVDFTTVNTVIKEESISMHLESGPFKTFQGEWRFVSLGPHSCSITVQMQFEFSNLLLRKVLENLFNQFSIAMMDAFLKQAAIQFGPNAQPSSRNYPV